MVVILIGVALARHGASSRVTTGQRSGTSCSVTLASFSTVSACVRGHGAPPIGLPHEVPASAGWAGVGGVYVAKDHRSVGTVVVRQLK
jgi:hypothetical protein